MNVGEKKREWIEWLAAACMALFALCVVWRTSGCFFETNDDSFMVEILSGSLGGGPEAHLIHLNYLLTYPLSLLYGITLRIPWYGLLFLTLQLLVYTAMIQSAFSRREGTAGWIPAAGILGSCFVLNLYITSLVEFTSMAALMAIGGYVCLLLNRNEKRGWFLFCFFEGMAFLLRDEAMLMIQPLGMAVCVSEFWRETRRKCGQENRETVSERVRDRIRDRIPGWTRKAAIMILVVGGVILAGSLGTAIGYRGEGWKDYNRYNQARVELFDYYGTPGYDEVKDILDQYGVSAAEYGAFQYFTLLGPNLGTECIEEIAAYRKSTMKVEPSVGEIAEKGLKMHGEAQFYRIGRGLFAVCAGAVLWMLLRRRWTMLLSMAALALGSGVVEGYLVYRGRLPQRVVMPLYFGETIFMAVIWIRDYLSAEKGESSKHCYAVMCLAALAVAAACFSSAKRQHDVAQIQWQWQKAWEERMVVIYGYCSANPENKYLLDIEVLSSYRTDVLETRLTGWQNCVYTGSWLYHSPVQNELLREYLRGEEENLYFIIKDNGQGEAYPPVAYLADALGKNPVVADWISMEESGEEYQVWCFEEK